MKRHVVILGLDGMPLHAFSALFDRGLMPYTKHLWQKLWKSRSVIDLPLTLPSWATISTGVNPGKHGVFDFFAILSDGSLRVITKNDLMHPTLPEILAYNGIPSVTINVPLTYPPATRRHDCIVISDWTLPRLKAWPPSEEERARRLLKRPGPPTKPLTVDEYLHEICVGLELRAELLEYYFTKKDWRVFYAVIPEPDWVFHKAYGELVGEGKAPIHALRAFTIIDKVIKVLHANMPDNTLLILCSDHGFEAATTCINGNVLLAKAGLLKTSGEKLDLKSKMVIAASRLLPSMIKHSLKYKLQVLASSVVNVKGFTQATLPIDYSRSLAFMTVSYNVYVNPYLPSSVRNQVRRKVMSLLSAVRSLFEVLELRENYFKGPYINKAPDIIAIPKPKVNISARFYASKVLERGKWYVHSRYGFIALHAEDAAMVRVTSTPIPKGTDVVPTVLAYLGVPIPSSTDGKPLVVAERATYRDYLGAFRLAHRLRGVKASGLRPS